MTHNQDISGMQSRISDINGQLEILADISRDHSWNSFCAWISGVGAPVVKPISKIALEIMISRYVAGNKMLMDHAEKIGAREFMNAAEGLNTEAESIKKATDLFNKSLELIKEYKKGSLDVNADNVSAEDIVKAASHFGELSAIIENDKTGKSLSLLIRANQYVDQEDYEKAFDTLGKAIPFGPVKNGVDLATGIEKAKENYQQWSSESDHINAMITKHRDQLLEKLNSENARLYEMSDGKLGSIDGAKNSPNVFTRIDAILTEITVNIHKVSANLN